MNFTELIREQAFQCIVMAAAGIFVMIFYQLFRNTCVLTGAGKIAAALSELVFWVLAAVAVSYFLYYCAYGRISFHAALSFAAGALLWKKFFCGIIDKIYMKLQIRQGIYNKYGEEEKKQPVQGHQSGDRH
jgi:hypothetical protein